MCRCAIVSENTVVILVSYVSNAHKCARICCIAHRNIREMNERNTIRVRATQVAEKHQCKDHYSLPPQICEQDDTVKSGREPPQVLDSPPKAPAQKETQFWITLNPSKPWISVNFAAAVKNQTC